MQNQANAELFPAVLRRPAALTWMVVLPSLLLALVNGFGFWLVWGEMKEASQHGYAAVLLVSSLLPALAGLFAIPYGLRKAEGLSACVQVLLGVLCLAHLVAFCSLIGNALPRDTPEWVVGPSFFLLQFACMMPGLFAGVWRIAGMRLKVRPLEDFGLSVAATFLPPALLYFLLFVVGRIFTWSRVDAWARPLFVAGLVAGPILFFLGLLRCLMLARRFFVQKGEKSRAFHMGYVGCVALVLPVAGLLLNKQIPFPADFQNPWPYVLTVLNAVFLMLPATGQRRIDAAVRLMRLVLFPFTCYFFVVFLPFLPLSIVAILAMGTGFLVLAPTLLFMVHGQLLKRDYEQSLASGAGRFALRARTAACLLALPLGFAVRTEFDRVTLHRALAFRYAPDYGADAKLSVAPAQVRRVLLNVRRFKDGAELPYITNWYNWRVFDNLLLQDEKAAELWRLIVGGAPPAPAREDVMRNAFASLFGGKTRSPGRRGGGTQRPVPRNVALADVQAAYSTTNGETETRVTLKVTSRDAAGQAEYLTTLTVPPGVWVSGFRLKIGGKWEDGRVIERKAAEWVYRQIRDVSRRDPAILRYDSEESLTLRVFPVAPGETREVEVDFVCPEGFADAVTVGERRVTLGDGTVKPRCVWSGGVLARNAAWTWPTQAVVGATSPLVYLVLDCSAGARWNTNALANVVEGVRRVRGNDVDLRVVSAHYETTPEARVPLGNRSLAAGALGAGLLSPRGALDADGVLRRLARRGRLSAGCAPEIVFAGDTVLAALRGVKAETWQAFRNELPEVGSVRLIGSAGRLSEFPVPGGVAGAGPATVLSMGADRRRDAGARSALVAFEGTPERPVYADAQTEGPRPIAGLVEMPPESRWAKGAAAWRLQRELDEHPARDPLRRAILKASRGSGVLTPAGSYIVVENSMQWKMLEVKQRQTLAGDAALDLVESPAPEGWLLLALFGVAVWVAKRLGLLKTKRNV